MFLETERLLLRKFRDEDFEDYFAYVADPELNRMMGQADLTDRGNAIANFRILKDIAPRSYVIVHKAAGRVIGNLNITPLPDFLLVQCMEELQGKNGVCLSFALSRQYRRQGLMTEAVSAVIERLFLSEGMDFIQCGHFDFNLPSQTLQKKLGFTFLTESTLQTADDEELHTIENILWREDWLRQHYR